MELRTQTALFCGALAIAIAVSILLRRRPGMPQLWFAAFAADTGLWYLAQSLYHFVRADVWERFTVILAVLLPQFALRLFEALMPETERRSTLPRLAGILLFPLALLSLFGPLERWWLRGIVFFYVFGLLAAGLYSLWTRASRSRSRGTRRRVRFLVFVGALAVAASLAEFLWFLNITVPPIGAAFSVLFLFVISESLIRRRFVDVYDVLGQVMLSAALATCLAAIFYVFMRAFGGLDTLYLSAFLATIVILVVFEPLREKVNLAIHRTIFRERADLERAVQTVRGQLAHVLEVDQMGRLVVGAIESSRRATAAAVLIREPVADHFDVIAAFGPPGPERLETSQAQALLESLESSPALVLDDTEILAQEARRVGDTVAVETYGRLLASAELLGEFRRGVVLALRGESRGLVGLLLLTDDRAVDAYSPDEVILLEELALQASAVLENSRQHIELQTRDRLAVLGRMAAGLAHEVRNPLGAIKGAAQLLGEDPKNEISATDREFISIILEEVDRLDRVVGSVLSYARPASGQSTVVDVVQVVERTARVLEPENPGCRLIVSHEKGLAQVEGDAEQLRQVLINLIRNAVQAMDGMGEVLIHVAGVAPARARLPNVESDRWVEISVRDTGPGIAPEVRQNLFVPFFTTKQRGSGLGLAISQRIVEEMLGRIEVTSQPGRGTTFAVLLPGKRNERFALATSEHSATSIAAGSDLSPDLH
jgi:two-component system sensor histidine kinase HydH